MSLRTMDPPAVSRTRTAKRRYSEEEVAQAVTMLQEGQNPGDGPYNEGDEEKNLRKARAEAQALVREIKRDNGDELEVGTRAWNQENGDKKTDGAYFSLRLR